MRFSRKKKMTHSVQVQTQRIGSSQSRLSILDDNKQSSQPNQIVLLVNEVKISSSALAIL